MKRTGGSMIAVGAAVLAALLAPGAAGAEGRLVNAELFAPAADSRGLVTVDRPEVLGHLHVSFGLWASYARNALVLAPTGGGEPYPVVRNLVTGNLHAALGLFDRAEIALLAPVSILEGPRDSEARGFGPRVAEQGLGDPSIKLKGEILDRRRHGIGVGVIAGLRFPGGGTGRDFMTSGGVELFPRLLVDGRAGRLLLAANVGMNLRLASVAGGGECCADAGGEGFAVGHELTVGLGAALALVPERLDVVIEANGRVGLTGTGDFWTRTPVEALAAVKVYLARSSFLVVGASYGVSRLAGPAYGAPEPRVFVGVTYEPSRSDRDRDGYDDDDDECPDEAEDFDGFDDGDGCPDLDDDTDGTLDTDDGCPRVPGPPENHGCPTTPVRGDRDDDRIFDDVDACPDEAEDYDGFDDGDGCNDRDNDIDGILDRDDMCPNEPEDFDDHDDGDGCPEDPAKVKRVDSKYITLEKIHFEHDKAVVKPESHGILHELGRALVANPHVLLLRVEGHTDSDGSAEYNVRLSAARAKAVRDFLVHRAGVGGERLVSKGFGESAPVDTNETDAGKAVNRRVEFVILKEETGSRSK